MISITWCWKCSYIASRGSYCQFFQVYKFFVGPMLVAWQKHLFWKQKLPFGKLMEDSQRTTGAPWDDLIKKITRVRVILHLIKRHSLLYWSISDIKWQPSYFFALNYGKNFLHISGSESIYANIRLIFTIWWQNTEIILKLSSCFVLFLILDFSKIKPSTYLGHYFFKSFARFDAVTLNEYLGNSIETFSIFS